MRLSHILRKNKGGVLPSRFIFFDVETTENKLDEDEVKLELKLGSACYVRYVKNKYYYQWKEFKKISEFWDFVFKKSYYRTNLYLIAHNIGFDFRVLQGFNEMKYNKFILSKFITTGSSNIWIFKKGNKKITCLDNMNYFKTSLEVLGKSIGFPKTKVDFNTVSDNLLMLYCRNDVLIMLKAWKLLFKFIDDNNLGNFSNTIAGQAFNSYRHRFMQKEIYIHNNEKAIKIERASYHGGRNECFYIGKLENQKYYLLDVNSMYPSVMYEYEYPNKFLGSSDSLNGLEGQLKKYCLIIECIIKTDEPIYPIIQNDKLIFPVGIFKTYLSTREIEYALKNNHIYKINSVYRYSKEKLFDNYVNFFYDKKVLYKNENNDAFSYLCKLFLNSLYGKFGQRNERYEKIGKSLLANGVYEYFDMDKQENIKERVINGIAEKSVGLVEGQDSFVSIPSHITADARIRLWKYIKIAERKNVYYCDTDSLIVNEQGYHNCREYISDKLGNLSLKEISNKVEIFGLKDYVFGNNTIIKGIKKDAIKISEGSYEQTVFEGIKGAIRKNRLNEMIITKNQSKILKRNYDKGIVLQNGNVIPFEIKEQSHLF